MSTSTPPSTSAGSHLPGHVDNSVFVDADIDFVWDLTNDVESWPQLFTEYASADILERHGDTVRFRLAMHPDENGKVWSWVSERIPDRATYSVVARRVEPGPFEFMDIRWYYQPEGSGTRMRWVQDFRMRPGAPLDTPGMTDRINANTAIQMSVVKDKVEAAARARPGPGHRSPRPTSDLTNFASLSGAEMTTIRTDGYPVVGPPPDRAAAHRSGIPPASSIRTVSIHDVPANRRRGGDIRTVLAPSTVGASAGFLGTLALQPGEFVSEHWHPYSEEFLFCVRGTITLRLDGEDRPLRADEGILIPIGMRHRLTNDGDKAAFFVFQLSPLAPLPRLGHVDTEVLPPEEAP